MSEMIYLGSVHKLSYSVMPDLIRHPDVVATKVVNHLKDWVPVFTGNPGFRPEFTPVKTGAGMTILIEAAIYKQTLLTVFPGYWDLEIGHYL